MMTRRPLLALVVCFLTGLVGGCGEPPTYWQGKIHALEEKMDELLTRYQALEKQAKSTSRSFSPTLAEGRLTTESGVPISTSDRTSQSTLYYTPYMGTRISLYSGTAWKMYGFSEVSLALASLTANTNYDVFLYNNSGTLTLELTVWSNDTTRATALVSQDGVLVRSGATTRRYLGTIRTTGTNTTEDSNTKRFVWNYENRVTRILYVYDTTNSWTYNQDAWRSANNSTANRVEFVLGAGEPFLFARSMILAISSSGRSDFISSGIGIDSTSVNSAQIRGSGTAALTAKQAWGIYAGHPGLGYHYAQWLERSNTTSITIYGDNGDATKYRSGLLGEISG